MWCIQTTQIVHNNLFISSALTFSLNSVEYCNISHYASYRNLSWCLAVTHVSWCVSYCEVFANTQPCKSALNYKSAFSIHTHTHDRWQPAHKKLMHTHSYTMGTAIRSNLEYRAGGHLQTGGVRDWIINILISRQHTLPPKPQLCVIILIMSFCCKVSNQSSRWLSQVSTLSWESGHRWPLLLGLAAQANWHCTPFNEGQVSYHQQDSKPNRIATQITNCSITSFFSLLLLLLL